MHQAEGAHLGLNYTYQLIDFDPLQLDDSDLPMILREAQERGFAGVNITHPFKESVIDCLDALSPDATDIGAVNTVVFKGGERFGYNTDCWGFAESFRRSMHGAPINQVLQLGAGGAGRAVARALLELGAKHVDIFDIDASRASALASKLADGFGAGRAAAIESVEGPIQTADGLVNATPIGMTKYPGMPVEAERLRPDMWVADIVYFPAETRLLAAAQKCGARTLSGVGMAVFQAARAFELFTELKPDADRMARELESAILPKGTYIDMNELFRP